MTVNTFLQKLLEIGEQLELLNRQFTDPYEADILPKTNPYRQKLADLSNITTHEIATEIGIHRHRILLLSKYIEFCEQFNEFSETALASIIDKDISIQDKKELAKQCTNGDFKLFLEKSKQIRKSWNQLFDNQSYTKVKSIIDL